MKKKITISYSHYPDVSGLTEENQQLVSAAQNAVKNAYAPYSKFSVGAAVLLDDGKIIEGNNQENIAYPSGLCAERVALFYAGANYPDRKVQKIAIASDGDLIGPESFLTPCGSCRQVMAEVSQRQKSSFEILLLNNDESVLVFDSINDLLPFVFGQVD